MGKRCSFGSDLTNARKDFSVLEYHELTASLKRFHKSITKLMAWTVRTTASNLAGDALEHICKDSNVQLLPGCRHPKMVENMMRSGTTSVFQSRFFKANNEDCSGFNPDQPSIYVLMIDANKVMAV